jgi:hypothetical protein
MGFSLHRGAMKYFLKKFETIEKAYNNKKLTDEIVIDYNECLGNTIKEKFQSITLNIACNVRNRINDELDG